MKFISYISVFMIPVLILYILGYGLIAKRNIYNDFVEGAEEGLKISMETCSDTDRADDGGRSSACVRFS